ncbi:hypothetical protein F4778DRAFT_783456 [Xylariomycetidae sp. FL2044]|nr:hypothetical protein F4778DRAFT_783456 [Xylariomycetidae sp. FL2044]
MASTTATAASVARDFAVYYYQPGWDWETSATLAPADFFQPIGGSAVAAPLNDNSDWLLNGLNANQVGSSGGGGGGGDFAVDVGSGSMDWSFPNLVSSHDSINAGNPLQTQLLDGVLPSSNLDHNFSFNNPPDPILYPDTSPSDQLVMSPSMPLSPGRPGGKSSSTPSSRRSPPVDPLTALKRQRNNVAARKYRQKRIDRITELESELKGVKQERDDLRLRLARQEAEAAALRSMLQMNSGGNARKGQSK